MKFFRFDSKVGRQIEEFGSANFILSTVPRLRSDSRVSCVHLGMNGVVGFHRAVIPQLFLVVSGEGWVRDETSDHITITPGHAAFWEKD